MNYVPNFPNLMSVGKVTDSGNIVVFDDHKCRIYDKKHFKISGKIKATGSRRNKGLYILDAKSKTPRMEANIAQGSNVSQDTWHKRLGHVNLKSLESLKERSHTGISFKKEEMNPCDSCIEGKSHRLPFASQPCKTTGLLELVHSDLCGPIKKPSHGGSRYFLTFTDDFSKRTWDYFVKNKSEVFEKFIEFKSLVENQSGCKIKRLRSDRGGEYISKKMKRFMARRGIVHEPTAPYCPEQNGTSERVNRTLLEK